MQISSHSSIILYPAFLLFSTDRGVMLIQASVKSNPNTAQQIAQNSSSIHMNNNNNKTPINSLTHHKHCQKLLWFGFSCCPSCDQNWSWHRWWRWWWGCGRCDGRERKDVGSSADGGSFLSRRVGVGAKLDRVVKVKVRDRDQTRVLLVSHLQGTPVGCAGPVLCERWVHQYWQPGQAHLKNKLFSLDCFPWMLAVNFLLVFFMRKLGIFIIIIPLLSALFKHKSSLTKSLTKCQHNNETPHKKCNLSCRKSTFMDFTFLCL